MPKQIRATGGEFHQETGMPIGPIASVMAAQFLTVLWAEDSLLLCHV